MVGAASTASVSQIIGGTSSLQCLSSMGVSAALQVPPRWKSPALTRATSRSGQRARFAGCLAECFVSLHEFRISFDAFAWYGFGIMLFGSHEGSRKEFTYEFVAILCVGRDDRLDQAVHGVGDQPLRRRRPYQDSPQCFGTRDRAERLAILAIASSESPNNRSHRLAAVALLATVTQSILPSPISHLTDLRTQLPRHLRCGTRPA